MSDDYPIAIMSFNRPKYLEPVLKSLAAQADCNISRRPIALFQDGAVNAISGNCYADQNDIDACVKLFMHYFPHGIVFESDVNLGVALNFERAENYVFNKLDAEAALFFEDDLIVSPFYVCSLENLLELALTDERIGYVAVYGYHQTPIDIQKRNPAKFVLLEHNWGFGLTKRQWLRNKPYVDEYLGLVRNYDYRARDANRIHQLFASWGLGCPGDSQDVAKTLACCLTGAVKLNTQACLGKYIGATGLHMKPSWYERLGYGGTEIFPYLVTHFEPLSSGGYSEIFRVQMRWATEKPCSEGSQRVTVASIDRPKCSGPELSNTASVEEVLADHDSAGPPQPRAPAQIASAGTARDSVNVIIGFFGVDRCPAVTAEPIKANLIYPIARCFPHARAVGHFNNVQIIHSPHSGEREVSISSLPGSQLGLELIVAEQPNSSDLRIAMDTVARFPFRGVADNELTMRRNAISKLWSLKRLRLLTDAFYPAKNADPVYCLFRPDLLYLGLVDIDECIHPIISGEYDMIVPDWAHHDGLNDRFVFCNRAGFSAYTSRFDRWMDVTTQLGYFHPETILAEVATENRIRVGFTQLRARRVRATGAVVDENWSVGRLSNYYPPRPSAPQARPPKIETTTKARPAEYDYPLNGIPYLEFMSSLFAQLRPRSYLEIGTADGASLACFECDAVCVDPNFKFNKNPAGSRARTLLYQMSSDEFFANHDLRQILSAGVDIAFLDGLHFFEVLLRDFINVEHHCGADSLILIHDCLPLNLRMAERTRRHPEDEGPATRPMWTGDVWRLPMILKEYRPDLRCVMLDCPPTGLFVVSNLDASSDVLNREYGDIAAKFADISLASFGIHNLWSVCPVLDTRSFGPEDLREVIRSFR